MQDAPHCSWGRACTLWPTALTLFSSFFWSVEGWSARVGTGDLELVEERELIEGRNDTAALSVPARDTDPLATRLLDRPRPLQRPRTAAPGANGYPRRARSSHALAELSQDTDRAVAPTAVHLLQLHDQVVLNTDP